MSSRPCPRRTRDGTPCRNKVADGRVDCGVHRPVTSHARPQPASEHADKVVALRASHDPFSYPLAYPPPGGCVTCCNPDRDHPGAAACADLTDMLHNADQVDWQRNTADGFAVRVRLERAEDGLWHGGATATRGGSQLGVTIIRATGDHALGRIRRLHRHLLDERTPVGSVPPEPA